MVQHVIDAANELGARQVHLVYGHGGDLLKKALSDDALNWVLQAEQLGTGHAMQQAAPFFADDEDILMLYGDVPLISVETLTRLRAAKPQGGIGLLTVVLDDPTGYGRITRENGHVTGIVEHKDASDEQRQIQEINTGILIANGADMKRWLSKLNNNNAQGEYYITDLVALALEEGDSVKGIVCGSDESLLGVNSPAELSGAEEIMRTRVVEHLMKNGVILHNPQAVRISPLVRVEPGVEITGPCEITGRSILHAGACVEGFCVIRDTEIEGGAVIHPFCHFEGAHISGGALVGPYSRLRPGADLGPNSHVGNFVELKKTQLGEGAKANHLSYLGDAHIGAGTNIGAGTITCNYDGRNKFQTTIGEHAFIGSNTALVAPVTVGAGALIGAGSTITKDIPEGELSIARARQKNLGKRRK